MYIILLNTTSDVAIRYGTFTYTRNWLIPEVGDHNIRYTCKVQSKPLNFEAILADKLDTNRGMGTAPIEHSSLVYYITEPLV